MIELKNNIIFHIDVNNAFLSWTAVYLLENGEKEDIRTIPSIIGGDEKSRHGIVLAKSPVAKKYKIVTAETIYSAKKKCPTLKIFPPNYHWYQEKSQELMNYLRNYSPTLEQLSIDECFLDMTGMEYIYKDFIKLAYQIKEEIKEKFKYTVNVGIANNRLCAKMASDFEKPDKVHTLFQNEIVTKLWPKDLEHLFMCGKKTQESLNQMGILTIGDLARVEKSTLEKQFKSQGTYLYYASRGIEEKRIESPKNKNQSISTTETLLFDSSDQDYLKDILFRQTEELTKELREKKLYVKTIGVIWKNNKFISYSAQNSLITPTNNTKEIIKTVYNVFDENYKEDEIRLIGVRLSNLTSVKKEKIQISIFDEEKEELEEEDESIQKTMDEINKKFGKSIIKPASLKLIEKRRETLKKTN